MPAPIHSAARTARPRASAAWRPRYGHVVGVCAVGEEDAEALDAASAMSSAASLAGRLVAGGVVVVGDEDPGDTVTREGLGVVGGEAGGPVGGGDVGEAGSSRR